LLNPFSALADPEETLKPAAVEADNNLAVHLNDRHSHLPRFLHHRLPGGLIFEDIDIGEGNPVCPQKRLGRLAGASRRGGVDRDLAFAHAITSLEKGSTL